MVSSKASDFFHDIVAAMERHDPSCHGIVGVLSISTYVLCPRLSEHVAIRPQTEISVHRLPWAVSISFAR